MIATDVVKLINDLLTGGVPVLLLYLYWTERQRVKETRDEAIRIQKELYEARIADYKLWLEIMNDLITSAAFKLAKTPIIPTPTGPQPPTEKSPKKSTSLE